MMASVFVLAAGLVPQAVGQVATQAADGVVIHPAPGGVPTTTHWHVRVNGREVPVFETMVFHGGPAFFCHFETGGSARVEARPAWDVRDIVVRPLRAGIKPTLDQHTIKFDIPGPCKLSVEPNHLINHPLFIFADAPETDAPDPDTPGVRYFGPGLHTIGGEKPIASGQRVHLAGGAWLRVVLPDDPSQRIGADRKGMPLYQPLFRANGAENIRITGRGVIDMSRCDWHSRMTVTIGGCRDVHIEGVTILDAPRWTLVVARSDDVTIENVKLIGHRTSNDGIDLVNSRHVTVRDCFTRVGDDGIVIKTFPGGGPAHDILVEDCVIWNDKVRGIGITGETAEPISRVCFRNISIIHDLTTTFGPAYSISICMADCGPIADIRFENIRCEDTRAKLIQIANGRSEWSTTEKLGPIEGVLFKDVEYLGRNRPRSVIAGNDAVNCVKGVRFENFNMNGKLIDSPQAGNIETNEHAYEVTFTGTAASQPSR